MFAAAASCKTHKAEVRSTRSGIHSGVRRPTPRVADVPRPIELAGGAAAARSHSPREGAIAGIASWAAYVRRETKGSLTGWGADVRALRGGQWGGEGGTLGWDDEGGVGRCGMMRVGWAGAG